MTRQKTPWGCLAPRVQRLPLAPGSADSDCTGFTPPRAGTSSWAWGTPLTPEADPEVASLPVRLQRPEDSRRSRKLMHKVRGRALGAGRGLLTPGPAPHLGSRTDRPGRARHMGQGLRSVPEQGSGKALGLDAGTPLNLRASPVQSGPGASLAAGCQERACCRETAGHSDWLRGNAASGEPCPSPSLLGPLSQR